MEQITQDELRSIYPAPVIRGTRITRMGERALGRLWLTPEVAGTLGEENIGVFIGDCKNLDRVVDRVREIDQHEAGGRWIIVTSTRRFRRCSVPTMARFYRRVVRRRQRHAQHLVWRQRGFLLA